jgi:MoaA/NifB/PqqE/SkfB family radical SAM enzyme
MLIKPWLVAFELSNRCNYAARHTRCPVDAKTDPIFLPTSIIRESLEYLGSIGFNGELYFSVYNEPLIDPRLFMLIELTKKHCPNCRVQLFTNGWSLNQQMVDELLEVGVGMFMVSAYSDHEENRLRALNYTVPSDSRSEPVLRIELDDRMDIYNLPANQTGPCWMPTIYPFVNHKGQFVLCCYDYRYLITLGNLNEVSFEEVYTSEFRQQVCESLEAGTRFFDVCKRCTRAHVLHELEYQLLTPLED